MIIELLTEKNLLVFLLNIKESLENPNESLMNNNLRRALELE